MKIKMNKLEIKELVESITVINKHVTISVNDDGSFTAKVIDPSHVSMISLHSKNVKFNVGPNDDVKEFCINIDKLKDVIKLMDNNDDLSLEPTEKEIIININKKNGGIVNRKIANIEGVPTPSLPKLNYTKSIKSIDIDVNYDAVRNAIKACETCGQHIKFTYENKNFIAESGELIDTISYDITSSIEKHDETNYKTYSAYSIDYIKKMFNLSGMKSTNIKMAVEYPINITFSNHFDITYLLAPKVKE